MKHYAMVRCGFSIVMAYQCVYLSALIEAGQSSDKIAHNAVRGVGHLLTSAAAAPLPEWWQGALDYVVCCLSTGGS